MYAARLAEEEASTPVTWWYTPAYQARVNPSPGILREKVRNSYLLTSLDLLFNQMDEIWRSEFP